MQPLPTVFISHGGPNIAIDDVPARAFMTGLPRAFPLPKAIVVISGHWEMEHVGILTGNVPLPTIYDFNGFEPDLYKMTYPAPGIGAVADELRFRLGEAGFQVIEDQQRGLDHGAWIPLSLMYPDATIPVTQISVNPTQSPLYHWRLGRALAPLSHDGVLILGSGSMTHNLAEISSFRNTDGGFDTPTYVEEFCAWVEDKITSGDVDALLDYRSKAPHAARAQPSQEHFLPLHVALGAAGVSWQGERVHSSFMYGSISMDSYIFWPDQTHVH